MSKKITLDPSIATILDIDSVAYNERVEIKFTASQNLAGAFEYVVYNSAQKNRNVKPANALTIVDKIMTLAIEPAAQSLEIAFNYYEIVHTTTKRVYFKGLLNIIK